jgi:hypothetical protein
MKKRQSLNKFQLFILPTLTLLIQSISLAQNEYCLKNGSKCLYLFKDSTYYYFYHRHYGIGPINDTLEHYGNYSIDGDTLILNSNIQPRNYENLEVTESIDPNSDNITIVIKPKNDIPLFFILPTLLRINNKLIETDPNVIDSAVVVLNKMSIKYFILGGTLDPHYPVYFVKNTLSNRFECVINEIMEDKDIFPLKSYFFDEKFLIKNDSLFNINYPNHIFFKK